MIPIVQIMNLPLDDHRSHEEDSDESNEESRLDDPSDIDDDDDDDNDDDETNDEDASLDSVDGSFEFMKQQELFRDLARLENNAPTATRLDLTWFDTVARDWNVDNLYTSNNDETSDNDYSSNTNNNNENIALQLKSWTMSDLRRLYQIHSLGGATTLERLTQVLQPGKGALLLKELVLKEALLTTRFPTHITAQIFDWIAQSSSLESLQFFGSSTDGQERALLTQPFWQAVTTNVSIRRLEVRRVSIPEESWEKLLARPALRHLVWIENDMESVSPEGLALALANNKTLLSIQWQQQQQEQEHVIVAMLKGIQNHPTLKDLNIMTGLRVSGNLLGSALALCPALETFFFSQLRTYGSRQQDYFCVDDFFRALSSNASICQVALRIQGSMSTPDHILWERPPLKVLDLALCEWSAVSRKEIVTALPPSRHVDLSRNMLHPRSLPRLKHSSWVPILDGSRALQKLDLRNCGLSSDDVRAMARTFQRGNVLIKGLDISFNHFCETDLQVLVDSLKHVSQLETLELCGPIVARDPAGNYSTIHGFALLSRLLDNVPSLCTVDLTDSTLLVGNYTSQVEQSFMKSVSSHKNLKAVTVDQCWLMPRQCRTLFSAVGESQTIQSLSAQYQNFALYLWHRDLNFGDVLARNSSLTRLDLEQSSHSPASATSLLRGLKNHQTIQWVHLGGIDCHKEFSQVLCEVLFENKSIKSLYMRLQKWSLPKMEVLYRNIFTCLAYAPSLQELVINDGWTGHPIMKSTGEILLQTLKRNTSLQSVRVSLTFLPYDMQDKILFYLRLNQLGRSLLQSETARQTVALWPSVLAKMTSIQDFRHLYYFVQDLVSAEQLIQR